MSDHQIVPPPRVSVDSGHSEVPPSPGFPKLPAPSLDVSLSLDQIIGESSELDPEAQEKVQKRASNVMKLAEENEKLNAELKAMTERLEAAERKKEELLAKQGGSETPKS